jgi:26S proteasome regulatory subunit T3
MLVKAVAHHTTASFIRVVGSEFVQKYLGEGPRMVRDVFRLARENSPSIIFIDEIDAIATKRFDAQTGADREVQRILLELLNQMDGFDQTSNVKVGLIGRVLSVGEVDFLTMLYALPIGDHGNQPCRHP